MKPDVIIRATNPTPFLLRSIDVDDIELLRGWKNEHRQYFFYKEIILEEQQRAWYSRWAIEPNDHMFMVEIDGRPIGCVGVRLFEGTADVYNVILGDKSFGKTGIMSEALCATVGVAQFLYPEVPVCVRVLTVNPAIGWYEKNGFVRSAENGDHVTMNWERPITTQYPCEIKVSIPFRCRKLKNKEDIK